MMKTVSDKEKFIWNMLGSLANALSTLVLTICVNRILGGASGGLFAFAYANAQLMLTIGLFEVRPYQSTDIDEKYSFNAYFTMRIVTCCIMIASAVMYTFISGFSTEKGIIVILLVLFKSVEAFTDVFGGRFQQKDRIDLSGKLFFIRVVASTIVFIAVSYITGSLLAASLGMFLTSFILFFIYDNRYTFKEDKEHLAFEFRPILKITIDVLPLFIGSFILMYLGNAPKYAINNTLGDEMQNVYSILSMPAFVINLISMFIFNPMLVKMAYLWKDRVLGKLIKYIVSIYGIIVVLTILAVGAAGILGIPVLSFVYGVNLEDYTVDLLLVMFVGGLSAFMAYANKVIAVMRQQKFFLLSYGIAFAYALICSGWMVENFGIRGAIVGYGISVAVVVLVLNIVIVISMLKRKGDKINETFN